MNIKLTIILSLISLIALSQTKTLYPSEAEQENIEYSDINKIEIFGNYIISKKDNKVGVYNVKSKSFVIPIKYDRINIFNKKDTIFIASFSKFEDVTKKNNQKITYTEEVRKKVLLNKQNKEVSEIYNEIKYIGYFDITIVENNKGFYDILDSTLKKINFSPYQLLYTKNLNKSKIIVAKQKEKYGIIDKNNNIVIPLVYDYISGTYDDKLIVQINNKAKVINLENKIILNTNFESISKPDYNNNHLVKKDFRQGIMNKNGKLLIPVKYKEIRIRNSLNAYFVYEDKEGLRKVGLYDLDCNLKIPIKYKYLTVVSHKNSENYSSTNRLIAKINGKYGVIDLDDNIVINHKYKSIKVIEQYIKDNILKNLASETKDIKKIEFIRDFFKGYVYEIIDFEKNTFLMNEKEEIIKTSYNNGYN